MGKKGAKNEMQNTKPNAIEREKALEMAMNRKATTAQQKSKRVR